MEEKEAIKMLETLKNRYAGKEYDESLRMAIKALKKQIPMDTKKFLIEFNRMCGIYYSCEGCPLEGKSCDLYVNRKYWDEDFFDPAKNNPKYFGKIIAAVEKWSKVNPKRRKNNEH